MKKLDTDIRVRVPGALLADIEKAMPRLRQTHSLATRAADNHSARVVALLQIVLDSLEQTP
jgi:hypothetical protein